MKSLTAFFEGSKNLYLREIDLPDPQHDEIQAKTICNGICMAEIYKYNDVFFPEPMLPGHEGVGVVTKVGKDVTNVREGDLVTTTTWGEYVNMPMDKYIPLQPMTQEQMKKHLVEPVSCVVTAADQLHLYPGESVVLFGAGYMGLLLVQLLRRYPLRRLTVADIKEENLLLAKEFGATEVINSGTAEGIARLEELERTEPFEVAYECSGAQAAFSWCERLLDKTGRLGVYAWHHGERKFDGHLWHTRGLALYNVSPWIVNKQKFLIPWYAADRMMNSGLIDQQKLITHEYKFEDLERAMLESTARKGNFIKSILTF